MTIVLDVLRDIIALNNTKDKIGSNIKSIVMLQLKIKIKEDKLSKRKVVIYVKKKRTYTQKTLVKKSGIVPTNVNTLTNNIKIFA